MQGLESLYQELQVLDALVYEIFLEDVSLADLEKKSPLEKCKLLMSKSVETTFMNDMSRLLLPFMDRIEKDYPGMKSHLLHDYLVDVANENLSMPLKFFEGQEEFWFRLLPDEVASIAVDCIYSYTGTDQLHIAQSILAGIPVQRVLSDTIIKQLDVLESELAACLILHRHNTPKSLGYIRDNKSDQLTVLQLLTRMARTVASSSPPPSEAIWSSLLRDILDLQRSVFSCVSLHTCYEIFCSTLLASGDMASIRLAESYLKNVGGSYHHVLEASLPREKCIALVLSAAREYMDSAGSFTDPAMDLAKLCLYLLPFEDEDLQEERNLLSAFQLLHDFGMKMLPIQVRLCPNRLLLIEECLKKKSGAHRNPSKLLQLAANLNICGANSSERQGRVLVRIAESAYSVKDYISCAETCNSIVAANYTDGWNITSKLAQSKEFTDLGKQTQLLNFALQHCPSEMLQELVDVRRSLEIESLQQLVKNQIVMHNSSLSSQLEGQNNSLQPESIGLDFLQSLQIGESSVQDTTQHILSCVGDTQFWKKALRIGWDESVESKDTEIVDSSDRHTCHAFYTSLFKSSSYSVSKLGCQYDCFSAPDIPPQLLFEQALLRISMLEQESGADQLNLPKVLLECALSLLLEDNSLGLGYLLSLPESYAVETSHQVFEANLSVVGLQLAQYHAALLWYCNVVGGDVSKIHNVFLYSPHEVISFANQSKCGDEMWKNAIKQWKSQLTDFVQAQDLLTLDCGVDVHRFASDNQYRHDSIIGLAMSEDSERLRFALALATRHGVDRGEVIAEHISNLILCDIPNDEVRKRLSSSELCNIIKESPEAIKEKLESYVFPNIGGKQINLLELYYSVLSQVAPSHRSARLLPKDHLKLLSKVKATTADIDYKLLISGPKCTIKAVESSLTVENIPLIAKLLKAMPASLASPLSMSQLYALHVKHIILDSRNVSVESLSPIFCHINGEDVTQVFESSFFCDGASELHCLVNIAESFITAALANCEFSGYSKELGLLTMWKEHIHGSRWLIEEWPEEECSKLYFHTKGERFKLMELLKECFLNEQKPEVFLFDLLKATSSAFGKSEDVLLFDIVKDLVGSVKENENGSSSVLNSVLNRLEKLATFGKLHSLNGEWESLLHPLATIESLPSNLRLKVFNILQQVTVEQVQEPGLLFAHTRAILSLSWPEVSVSAEDVLNEECRANLLLDLIQSTDSWQQRNALQNILDLWPSFDSIPDDKVSSIYHEILKNCVLSESGKWTDDKATYIIDVSNRHPISYNFLENFLSNVQNEMVQESCEDSENEDDDSKHGVEVQLLILVCLLCNDLKARMKAVSLAHQQLMEPLHPKVAELAIRHSLTVDLLATPAYAELLSEVLDTQPSTAGTIVKALVTKNHLPEAGSVILRSINSVPRFMRTFSASIVAGLSQTSLAPGLMSKSRSLEPENNSGIAQVESQSSSSSPAGIVAREELDNDWDAAENEWSDIEENEVKSDGGTSRTQMEKLPKPRAEVMEEPKSDTWEAHEGWDNWSEEEVEEITSRIAKPRAVSQEDHQSMDKLTTPPLLPSPQSAFARVPPRELRSVSVSPSPALLQTVPPSVPQVADETIASSDWGDGDWNADWES